MLIDRFVPRFDVQERHRITIAASPERVWAALHELDLGRSLTVRWLFAARGIRAPGRRASFSLADAERLGFVVLGEDPGTEIVLGAIGRFWRPTGGLLRIAPGEFTTFERRGYAKGALNFRLSGAPGGTAVLTETRVVATDLAARRRFRRYWRVIRPFSGWIRRRALTLLKAVAERSEEEPGECPGNPGGYDSSRRFPR